MDIEIIPFSEEHRDAIRALNVEWLEKYFHVEPGDVIQLADPVHEIIDKGGKIFYAIYKGEIVGTASLMRVDINTCELAKMAVTDRVQGLGIGTALMDHSLYAASDMDISRLVLYSNTKLGSAIHLYRKYGFYEVPLEPGHYERANIKMEKIL